MQRDDGPPVGLRTRPHDGGQVNNHAYTWTGRADLTEHKKSWLRGACRERKIKPKGMTRRQMVAALLTHGRRQISDGGWGARSAHRRGGFRCRGPTQPRGAPGGVGEHRHGSTRMRGAPGEAEMNVPAERLSPPSPGAYTGRCGSPPAAPRGRPTVGGSHANPALLQPGHGGSLRVVGDQDEALGVALLVCPGRARPGVRC
jgi:hypothetical protein